MSIQDMREVTQDTGGVKTNNSQVPDVDIGGKGGGGHTRLPVKGWGSVKKIFTTSFN
jgi:hypothetical protein